MNFVEVIPWSKVAAHLHERLNGLSGVEGAVIGAALGAATTIATMNATSRKASATAILAGAAVGMAYGATGKDLLQHFTD